MRLFNDKYRSFPKEEELQEPYCQTLQNFNNNIKLAAIASNSAISSHYKILKVGLQN